MKFTPDYTVSYKGAFHPAGKPFDIDVKDATEMQRHGKVEQALPDPPDTQEVTNGKVEQALPDQPDTQEVTNGKVEQALPDPPDTQEVTKGGPPDVRRL